ncbi:hypothetical protein PN36_29055 [Candidatus Thiomargarita nelsonii]|uniref:Uncharacterized protein n=1 Tax=Candidatus Thiomargarita nelsonii TaxID=1003181 RepID=A0A4E0QK81_9GAMM|nr:hypothetical protein PN36_29055 [Candidatus Thiomargarita nelsonii]
MKGDQVRCREVIKIDKANMKGKKRDRAIRLNTDAKRELLSYSKGLIGKGLELEPPLFGGRWWKNSYHTTDCMADIEVYQRQSRAHGFGRTMLDLIFSSIKSKNGVDSSIQKLMRDIL